MLNISNPFSFIMNFPSLSYAINQMQESDSIIYINIYIIFINVKIFI